MNVPYLTMQDFKMQMHEIGFVLFPGVVPSDLLVELCKDLDLVTRTQDAFARERGVKEGLGGGVFHIVGSADSFVRFLEWLPLDSYISEFFDNKKFILNTYGAFTNLPEKSSTYAHGIAFHRDARTYSKDFKFLLNMLVMLDEFTVENGATKMVPGGHLVEARPSDEELEAKAIRLTGPAGSIALFDSNVWHAASLNTTMKARRALTLNFSRAFVKQQFDFPRFLGEDFPKSEKIRQILGYNARVPANFNEWFRPGDYFYKKDQG